MATTFQRFTADAAIPTIKKMDEAYSQYPTLFTQNLALSQFNWVFDYQTPKDKDKGWQRKVIGYSMMYMENKPERGEHLMAKFHKQIPQITLENKFYSTFRDTYSTSTLEGEWVDNYAQFMATQLQAFKKTTDFFMEFIVWYTFGSDTELVKDKLLNKFKTEIFAKSDGDTNGYPFASEFLTYEKIKQLEDQNKKKELTKNNPLKKQLDAIKQKLATNTKKTTMSNNTSPIWFGTIKRMNQLVALFTGAKDVVNEMLERKGTYMIDKTTYADFVPYITRGDLVAFVNENDLRYLRTGLANTAHPEILGVSAESLGVSQMIASPYTKAGEIFVIDKRAVSIHLADFGINYADYPEHGIVNIFTRGVVAPVCWDIFQAVTIQQPD